MSLARAVLVTFQALCNGLACTPPNKTRPNTRYHTEELYILQIAPLIFKCHQLIAYACAFFEVAFYLRSLLPTPTSPALLALSALVCPLSPPPPAHLLRLTPSFLLGVLAVALGAYIRLDCFRALGPLFTFDLTLHPQHRLITSRFYSYVRHPAYTGSLLLVVGLAFSHLTQGAWMTECGLLRGRAAGAVWAAWWLWTLCVGISRADAEDRQMRGVFGKEWDAWAAAVHWWFLPGLI
ncbi:hypothetical protein BJ912DRAFT_857215 [Pholiota molesta]|nr:hypothetical protein BJ912DRAFT_857215 [Pholiota molesta]